MAQTFSEFLADQKKSSPGLKEKVNIATAGTTFYLNHIKEKGLGRQYIETNKVSNAGTKLTEEFRGDIEMLDGADYRGFVSFIRKYQTALNELPKNRNLSPQDREYVESAIKDPLTQIATIRGPVLRLAYGLEDFKKEFKPLKLADRLLGDVPIIGNLIKGKIEDIESGEQAVIRAGRDAAKQKARQLQKQLGLDEDEGDDFADTGDMVSPGGGAQSIERELTTERLEDEGRLQTTPSFGLSGKKRTEEQRKEANIEREETQNIFEAIMANTAETNDILKELIDETKEGQEGLLDEFGNLLGGTALTGASLLGAKKLLNKKTALTGAKVAATTAGATSAVATTKTSKGTKIKNAVKKSSNLIKTSAKGVVSKAPWLLPIIAGYDIISGFANADQVLESAPDEELSYWDKFSAGLGKAVDTATFGLVNQKSTGRTLADAPENVMSFFGDLFSSKDNNEALLDSNVTKLPEVRTIDTDVVNLKANELRSTNLENMLSKMVVEIPDMGSYVNQNLNTQTNNNTILPDVGSINEEASVVKDRISNYK